MLKRLERFYRAAILVGAAALALVLQGTAYCEFNLTLVTKENSTKYELTWVEAVDQSSTTARTTYYIVERLGLNVNPLFGGTTIATHNVALVNTLTVNNLSGGGSSCVVIVASNSVSDVFDHSTTQCHSYLHSIQGGNENHILREDGNKLQLGFSQQWKWTYFLDRDSEMTFEIHYPTTPFSVSPSTVIGATGFMDVVGNPTPVKRIVDHAPRSGELGVGASNTEFWDSSDGNGTVVGNGLYLVRAVVTNPLLTPTTRYIGLFTVPVDVVRFTEFSTLGISESNALAKINYTVTADAEVRIVIAKPGSTFTLDSSSNVVPVNAQNNIDLSTATVVTILTFNRSAGTHAESWNGTDSNGVAVSSGVYSVGVSGTDGFGNKALNISGSNDGPVSGTMPVDRQASQIATDTTPPTVTAATISSSLASSTIAITGSNTTIFSSFTTITITLDENAGTGSNISLVNLTDPASAAVPGGNVTSSGNNLVVYTTATVQTATGTWTITVTAKDTSGNTSSARVITFNLGDSSDVTAPTVSSVTVNGSTIALTGTTFTSGFSAIVVTLSEAAGIGAFTSTITVINPSAAVIAGTVTSSNNTITYSTTTAQTSTGTYTITINARDVNGNAAAAKVYSFIINPVAVAASSSSVTEVLSEVIPYPNPVKVAPANIEFVLSKISTVEIEIFTLLGQRLFRSKQTYPAGTATFPWNLVNQAGSKIANGVYLVRITADNGTESTTLTKKLMVLK